MGPVIRGRLPLLKRWNQWLFRKQAALIVGRTRDSLKDGPKVIFAPHAVSAVHFRPAKKKRISREPTFLFVGVPSHTKGLDLFARAAGRAVKEVGFRCRLVGASGTQARELAKNFRAAGFRGALSCRGFLSGPALRKEYQQADVFVFPSRFDTYGVVVHEATCCGLPVLVSCRAGASQNLVVEGKNGYIIDPENTEQFAARLVELARNPRRLRQMSRESRKLGVLFSVEKQARRVAAKISRLLVKGATPPSRQPRA
jgi:glycosyltransferase involved in cell wall biosynthesis